MSRQWRLSPCAAQVLKTKAARQAVAGITKTPEGKEGLLAGLEEALQADGPLRAQVEFLINKQVQANGGRRGLLLAGHSFR